MSHQVGALIFGCFLSFESEFFGRIDEGGNVIVTSQDVFILSRKLFSFSGN
jgi:hypothetical protein